MLIVNNVLQKVFQKDLDNGILKIPEGVIKIEEDALNRCYNIKEILLPNSLKIISKKAFMGCSLVKEIVIPSNVERIEEGAFSNCFLLEKILLPKSLLTLGNSVFSNCSKLKSIEIPENIQSIKESTFANCSSLEHLKLPSNLKTIDSRAFFRCKSINSLDLPKSLIEIGERAFLECAKLQEMTIPEKVTEIGDMAFYGCKNLCDINFPKDVKSIGSKAFLYCPQLKEINIPKGIEKLGYLAFDFEDFKSLQKIDDGYKLSTSETKNVDDLLIDENNLSILNMIISNYEDRNVLLKELKSKKNLLLINTLYMNLGKKDFSSFLNDKNLKFFNQFDLSSLSQSQYLNFVKLYYNLGGFKTPITQVTILKNGEKKLTKVDYAQHIAEFLKDKVEKNIVSLQKLSTLFEDINFGQFKSDFTDFFIDKDNFVECLKEEEHNPNFVARCYDSFEEIQETNTSNKGKQRQLKPTITKFKDFFLQNKFKGINDHNRNIAEVLSNYFSSQTTFDRAVEIDRERIQKGTKKGILETNIREKDVFETIENYQKSIKSLNKDTLSILAELASKKFTFEWLSKDSALNFVLGKLCSCCSHLEGAGYGIMHASIIHPDIQNLVIEDGKGKIVGKSTLFVNREEQYGICNNVGLNNGIVSDTDKQIIYEKFIMAIKLFAEQYNRENKKKPLKQINVGMNANDLQDLIRKFNVKQRKLLKNIDYGQFGIEGQNYYGDSDLEQFIIWKNDKFFKYEKPFEREK